MILSISNPKTSILTPTYNKAYCYSFDLTDFVATFSGRVTHIGTKQVHYFVPDILF